jgi:RNA polymerase sigma-70 factor (ECF subfamily)
MASKLNERELVLGLKEKKEEAYRRLIEEYSGKLYRLAFRILRQEEEAREVLQEAFLKVVTKIESFHEASSLYTWLYRITLNEALMRKRGSHSHQELPLEDYLPHYEFGVATDVYTDWSRLPDELFEKEEVRSFVQACVEELPKDLKSAYLLKDVEGLSEEEVCGILEISRPAMKNRVHRARLILRKRIEDKYAG